MCGLEFSDIEPSFWQAFKGDGLVVVGINPGGLFGGDTADIMEQFREQTGATFPIGWDTSSSYSRFAAAGGGAISPFPLDVVIDSAGTVRYVSREYEPTEMRAIIELLLSE